MAGKKVKAAEPIQEAPVAANDDKIFAALSYVIAIIVPLFIIFTEKKQNKELAFHAWQSLIFSGAVIVVYAILLVLTTVLSFIPVVGILALPLACLMTVLVLGVLITMLFLAYKAYMGEKYKLPIVGEFAEKQANQ